MNNHLNFDDRITTAIGCYVYLLMDPTKNNEVFYVGKGGGAGDGNERVLAHFEDARNTKKPNSKVERINTIWAAHHDVSWAIVRHGMSEQEALHVEAALIDAYPKNQLTNLVGGHGVRTNGLLWPNDVYAMAAPLVNPISEYPCVLIFQIHKALQEGKNPYDATRGSWSKVPEKFRVRDDVIAIGLKNGISRCVIKINKDSWTKNSENRWIFEGACFHADGEHELLNKNFNAVTILAQGYIQHAGYPVVAFDGRGACRYLRGCRNKEVFQICS